MNNGADKTPGLLKINHEIHNKLLNSSVYVPPKKTMSSPPPANQRHAKKNNQPNKKKKKKKKKKKPPLREIDVGRGLMKNQNNKLYFNFVDNNGRVVKARTGCILLHYNDPMDHGELKILMVVDPEHGHLEVPGGKVEMIDHSIYDTAIREFWEEVILNHDVTKQNPHCEWIKLKREIRDTELYQVIEQQLDSPKFSACLCCDMKTVYFGAAIPLHVAQTLIQYHGMISFPVSMMSIILKATEPHQRGYGKPLVLDFSPVETQTDATNPNVFNDPAIISMKRRINPKEKFMNILNNATFSECNQTHKYISSDTSFHVGGEIYRLGNREFMKLRSALRTMKLRF